MIHLSPEREAELLAAHHKRQAEREATEAAFKVEADKLKASVNGAIARQNKPVTTRKNHVCECCGEIIEKGNLAQNRTVKTGYGFPEGFHLTTYYRHFPKCP